MSKSGAGLFVVEDHGSGGKRENRRFRLASWELRQINLAYNRDDLEREKREEIVEAKEGIWDGTRMVCLANEKG